MKIRRDLTKNEIESLLYIINWNPNDSQIRKINQEIHRRLDLGEQLSISDGVGIVIEVCDDARFIALEGIDNSDLNTLITLATKVK